MKRSTRLQRPGLLGGSTANTLLDADGPQPSLNLDFASGILDPRITFTRSTVGTYYRGQFNQNLALYSSDPINGFVRVNVTVGTAITAPDGTASGFPITVTTTGVATTFRTGTITVDANSVTASCFIKKNVNDTIAFNLFDTVASATTATATFTFSTLAVSVSGCTATATDVGNGWYRIAISATWVAANGLRFLIGYNGGSGFTAGDSFYVWGVQVSGTAQATPYIPTTGTAITQGQIASAAIDVPRFENDPVTGEARGLLIEGGITNLCIRSEEFNTWAKVAAGDIVTANAGTAPDGLVTADKIIADTTSGAHGVNRSVTTTGSTTYTQSVFVKAAGWNWIYMSEGNTLTATAWFNVANGTVGTVSGTGTPSAKIQHIGNGWYRCTLTFTTNAGQVTANIQVRPTTGDNVFTGYVGNGVDGVLAWGAQVEAQPFASSYLHTTIATVARGDDSAVMTGTNFSNWFNPNEGTFFTNHVQGLAAGTSVGRFVGTANFNNSGSTYIDLLRYDLGGIGNARAVIAIGGTTQSAISSAVTGSSISKSAHAYSVGNAALSCNAENVVTGTPAALPSPNQLRIGASTATTLFLNGNIRQIAYWPTRLPNATLQSLTA